MRRGTGKGKKGERSEMMCRIDDGRRKEAMIVEGEKGLGCSERHGVDRIRTGRGEVEGGF